MTGDITDMRWPGLRSKLWPITVVRLPRGTRLIKVSFRDWYFGAWMRIVIGPWWIMFGRGSYNKP